MIRRRLPGAPDAAVVVERDARARGRAAVAEAWASAREDAGDGARPRS